MIKIRFLLICLILSLSLPLTVLSQKDDPPVDDETVEIVDQPVDNELEDLESNETVETDSSGKILDPFFVEIEVGPQSPWSNKVPLTVKIRSKIDASRTEVTWEHGFGIEIDESKYKNYFPLAKDAETEIKAYLKPTRSGQYTFSVNVTDWGYGRNYSSTDTERLTIDEGLLVTPVHPQRSTLVILRYVTLLALFVGLIFLIVIFGKKFVQWLKIWLQPPPV